MKFPEGISNEKVSVYAVPFVDTSGCSVRKYVDLVKHDKTTSLMFIKIALRVNARRHLLPFVNFPVLSLYGPRPTLVLARTRT